MEVTTSIKEVDLKKNNNDSMLSKDSLQFLDDLRANNNRLVLDPKKDT
jgi:hypothetical protein